MQYSLMIYQSPAQFAARTDPARRDANQAAFGQFVGALHEAGAPFEHCGPVEVRPTRVVPSA